MAIMPLPSPTSTLRPPHSTMTKMSKLSQSPQTTSLASSSSTSLTSSPLPISSLSPMPICNIVVTLRRQLHIHLLSRTGCLQKGSSSAWRKVEIFLLHPNRLILIEFLHLDSEDSSKKTSVHSRTPSSSSGSSGIASPRPSRSLSSDWVGKHIPMSVSSPKPTKIPGFGMLRMCHPLFSFFH